MNSSDATADRPGMSPYEAKAWAELNEFWQRKANRRSLPPKAQQAKDAAAAKMKGAGSATGEYIGNVTPQPIKDAGGIVIDWALEPTVDAVLGLLEWVTETVQEFSDPEAICAYHRDRGRPTATLVDLQALDLQHLDEFTRGFVWRCRTTGVVEGAALGLVTFIPVAGSVAAIGLDLVIIHALSTAIATRAAYAYGQIPQVTQDVTTWTGWCGRRGQLKRRRQAQSRARRTPSSKAQAGCVGATSSATTTVSPSRWRSY